MTPTGERILLVESDPDISDQIARQVLQPLGYEVLVAMDANVALKQAPEFSPDLLIINLNLPGLRGTDLLVALTSQGFKSSFVMLAEGGEELDLIQAFRMGATDYLLWPAKDAEIAATIERAMKQVREARTRQRLRSQLEEANQELQQKVRELTTLISLGKAVVSETDQRKLFDRIIEGALQISRADIGWLSLRDGQTNKFLLTVFRNLPPGWAKKVGQPLEDGVSSLVALSGESLTITGEPMQKLRIAALGKAAAVIPIKAREEVIGMLIMVRESETLFGQLEQTLLETAADYASISLVNAQLFRALERSAEIARSGEEKKNASLENLRETASVELQKVIPLLETLLDDNGEALSAAQEERVKEIRASIHRLTHAVENTIPPVPKKS
ncbi:MAG: response regulator [Anaerolineales bacterium]|nr:response regulator [Anaerolineales bacterium]